MLEKRIEQLIGEKKVSDFALALANVFEKQWRLIEPHFPKEAEMYGKASIALLDLATFLQKQMIYLLSGKREMLEKLALELQANYPQSQFEIKQDGARLALFASVCPNDNVMQAYAFGFRACWEENCANHN